MVPIESVREALLEMASAVADHREMAILGEGNISGLIDEWRFLVKASGTQLSSLRPEQLVEVDATPLRQLVESEAMPGDEEVERVMLDARADRSALKPSVESLFHAWLLGLPGIRYVGHTHAIAVNQLLCSPRAREYAEHRLIPDQIVYCGARSVLVPYVDPGLALARRIAREVEHFRVQTGRVPKTILLENHGIIALGGDVAQVVAALSMAEKTARIFLGAAALGGPVFMDPQQVSRIDGRTDEHYRQRMLTSR